MRFRYGLAFITWVLLGGCARYMAHKIEHPDRSIVRTMAPLEAILRNSGFTHESLTTPDGVRVAYWRSEPRAYDVKERFTSLPNGRGLTWQFDLDSAKAAQSALLPVQGSVVLLHPWEAEGAALALWAYHFAAAGYVVVMPDLRSQGTSGLAPVGYGPRESVDVAALVDALRKTHRLPAPLFLMGASYGGTVALFSTQRIGSVHGVMALEPYGNAGDVIRRAPHTGLFAPRWVGRMLGQRSIDKAMDRASSELGVDLDHLDASQAIDAHTPCTLILHGANDTLITAASLHALAEPSQKIRYVELDGENHISLPIRTDRLAAPLVQWMQQLATSFSEACPSFAPLPSSATASEAP